MKILQLGKSLWPYLRRDRMKIILCTIIIIISSLIGLSYGYLSGKATEELTNSHFDLFFLFMGIYLVIEVLGTQVFKKSSQLLLVQIELNLTKNLSYDIFTKVLKLPAKAFEEKTTGEMINRITADTETITEMMNQLLLILLDLFGCILILIYIFANSWLVGLEVVFYMIIIYFLTKHYMPKMKKINQDIKRNTDEYIAEVNQCITGIREIKALGIGNRINQSIHSTIELIFGKRKNLVSYETKYRQLIQTLNCLFEVGTYMLCGILIYYGKTDLTFFIAMTYYVYRYMGVISSFSSLSTMYQKVLVAMERVTEIIGNKLYLDEQFGMKKVDTIEGKIIFQDVSFGYEKDNLLLKHMNVILPTHQKLAIVGKSGQGKSTIFNLLLRLFDPNEGTILIDDIPISEFDEESLRKHISIIRQEPFLFHKTIFDNFRMVDENISLKKVRNYCKKAKIDDYIMSLPNQYDTLIGEGGVNLSGGQKQRLAIARALVKESKIILLDEATSALDNESQSYIKSVIDDLSSTHTVIIIAHRLSTIVDSDTIFVIDKGKIVDQGTHKQLMKSSKIYQTLYQNEEI